jgi:diadenosine tetraphosphate (Ap4A) HIT family hydrolase
MNAAACELCTQPGGRVLHDDGRLRAVLVDEPDYPGFVRIIWNVHVRELTDLAEADRDHLMRAVFAVEQALRVVMQPHKLNVASLGNLTPHLHWHVIPRFEDDPHFPRPVWAERLRDADIDRTRARRQRLPALEQAIVRMLGSESPDLAS